MKTTRGEPRHWMPPLVALVVLTLVVAVLQVQADAADPAAPGSRALQWSRGRPDTITGVDLPPSMNVVALSFDDGPDPRWTPDVLRVLDQHAVKATFFLTGEHVAEHPALARDVAARGHEIANHTYDHPDLPPLDAAAVRDQVLRANAAFREAGLVAPTLFRPPRGLFDEEAAAAVRATGLVTAGWTTGLCIEKVTVRSPGLAPADVAGAVLRGVRPGAVILGHDGGSHDRSATVAALPHLLAGLRDAGYRVVTVSELLGMARAD